MEYAYAIRIGFKSTNNEFEYEAFLAKLRVEPELRVESLNAFSDSQLVVNQVQEDYLAKYLRMVAYLDEMKTISMKIKDFNIRQIPREENRKSNALANLASSFDFTLDRSALLEFLTNSSIDVAKIIFQAVADPTWMDDIITYLQDGKLPSDRLRAWRIQYRLTRFCLLHGTL